MTWDPRTSARTRTPFGNFEIRRTHLKTKVDHVPYQWESLAKQSIREHGPAARITCAEHVEPDQLEQALRMLGIHPDQEEATA